MMTLHSPSLVGLDFTALDGSGSTASRRLFRSRSTAAAFALTRAAACGDALFSLDFSSFASAAANTFRSIDEVSVTGSVAELACALASLADYAIGVRRAQFPLPVALSADISTLVAAVASPVHPSRENDTGSVEVHVCTMRPVPLPDTRSLVGIYAAEDAERVAGVLAYRLGGEISPAPSQGRIQIHHPADLGDSDRDAIERYTRITELRANLTALGPLRDDEMATRLTDELDALNGATVQRRTTPSAALISGTDLIRRYLNTPPTLFDTAKD
ncbi:MAG: hypothetical protein JHC70_05115 [Rhodococcus sp.]|nr:hypothetical protein [Rhodococcus sp. (in: high G+C Gram-positive bacteria)]MBJ7321708.1 hypothetical protein [Rhodococcus sp. (in: high G+C Gram-positive bacteria)]